MWTCGSGQSGIAVADADEELGGIFQLDQADIESPGFNNWLRLSNWASGVTPPERVHRPALRLFRHVLFQPCADIETSGGFELGQAAVLRRLERFQQLSELLVGADEERVPTTTLRELTPIGFDAFPAR